MPQLVSVRFKYNPKPFWFDPQGKEYAVGTEVLVETERGREIGTIHEASIEVTNQQVSKLKTPLKPVVRELSDLDYDHLIALEEKGSSAMPFFREKIEEYALDIKPVEVQYVYSGERAIFYFSSEERVDFRDLVRDLAQHFHVRIDMRQIGARDEAKELGGLAHCGEEFCCTRFGGEFQPVSIRMAKEQDLPLNPTKISGACGRLMCCLRYEYEAYKDFKKRAPKKGTAVETPLGGAVISGYNTPSEMMELKLEDGKKLNVPLEELNCKKDRDGSTRCSVSNETIERCATRSMLIALGALDSQFENETVADLKELEVDLEVEPTTGTERRRRRRSPQKTEEPTARVAAGPRAGKTPASKEQPAESKEKPQGGTRKRRRRSKGDAAAVGSPTQKAPQKSQPQTQKQRGKAQPQGQKDPSQTQGQKQQSQSAAPRRREQAGAATQGTDKPRPGQRSSGLRKRRSHPGSKEG